MTNPAQTAVGTVVALWQYPIKSMLGEELNASAVTECGLLGDRAAAVVDRSTGKVASAKHPRKWEKLFDFRAAFLEPPRVGKPLPPIRITLPDGTMVSSVQGDLNPLLSQVLGREVSLETTAPAAPSAEYIEAAIPRP